MHIDIEWSAAKADANLRKHQVSFEEAATALLDPLALATEDSVSTGEPRWILVGMSVQLRILIVVYTLRRGERIRVISARRATQMERVQYAQTI